MHKGRKKENKSYMIAVQTLYTPQETLKSSTFRPHKFKKERRQTATKKTWLLLMNLDEVSGKRCVPKNYGRKINNFLSNYFLLMVIFTMIETYSSHSPLSSAQIELEFRLGKAGSKKSA